VEKSLRPASVMMIDLGWVGLGLSLVLCDDSWMD
jgi:hypothetical protein